MLLLPAISDANSVTAALMEVRRLLVNTIPPKKIWRPREGFSSHIVPLTSGRVPIWLTNKRKELSTMKKFNFLPLILLATGVTLLTCFSAQAAKPKPASARQMTLQEHQKMAEKRKKQLTKKHEMMLNHLKKKDPARYEQFKAHHDRQQRIDKLVTDLRNKRISNTEARKSLLPLIAEHSQGDLGSLDERITTLTKTLNDLKAQLSKKSVAKADFSSQIAQAEARLQLLQEIKSNPKKLTEFRVDNLLGNIKPRQKDLLGRTFP